MYLADAQTTFYVVGIVFMIFVMVVFLVGLIVVLTIAARIKKMQNKLKSRLDMFKMFGRRGKGFAEGFRRGMSQ